MGKTLVNIVLLVVSILVCGLLIELGARLAWRGWELTGPPGPGDEAVYTGHTVELEPTTMRMNSLGFRDREYEPEKPQGVTRILVLGDSAAFGQGVEAEENFPSQLEALLNSGADTVQFEVINFALPGEDLYSQLERFRTTGSDFDPDLVLVTVNKNDFTPLSMLEVRQSGARRIYDLVEDARELPVLEHSKALSHLSQYVFFQDQRHYESGMTQENFEQEFWPNIREPLDSLRELTGPEGTVLKIVLIPFIPYPEFSQHLAHYGKEYGIEVIDLHAILEEHEFRELTLHEKDPHPNPLGHRMMAEELYERLKGAAPSKDT